MADIKAKKVIFKNRDGEYLIPYIGDTAIENRITNCLLEVPQNIKLELADGVLTLKAGSKVIVPNGVGVFDEIVNSSNLTMGDTSKKGQYFVATNLKTSKLIVGKVSDTVSGTTAPTVGYSFFYNTDTNTVLRYGSDVITAGETDCSFPIAIVTMDTTGIVSIDQVFNGIGYIGSTIWVDKGVKGLIPNGRNEDGTLRNIEINTTQIKISNQTKSGIRYLVLTAGGFLTTYYENSYDEKGNYNLSEVGEKQTALRVGICDMTSGVISDFKPKLPFRAVDYNDINPSKIDGQWIPTDEPIQIHSSANATMGHYTYDISEIIPKDGYCYEILCDTYLNTDADVATYLYVSSTLIAGRLQMCSTRKTYAKYASSALTLPIGTDRIVNVGITGANALSSWVRIHAYRRIGTNQ